MTPQIVRMNGMNKNEQILKVSEMSKNRLNWVGIDLTSVPAQLADPSTSRTVTEEVYWSASDPVISIRSFYCHGSRLSRGPALRAQHPTRTYPLSRVRTALCIYAAVCLNCFYRKKPIEYRSKLRYNKLKHAEWNCKGCAVAETREFASRIYA